LPNTTSRALHSQVVVTPDSGRQRELDDVLEGIPGLDLQHAGKTQLSITHAQGHLRIDTVRGGVFGGELVMLEDADGGL
jgi:hypothetical protein